MIICDIPKIFQPSYKSSYIPYGNGENIEELFYDGMVPIKDDIVTDLVYLPVFWTSFYILRNYGANIVDLQKWLDSLDTTKQYFTVVQYATGILVENPSLYPHIKVFSAGGGGFNNSGLTVKMEHFNGLNRHIFNGNTGDHTIPLFCQPSFPFTRVPKDIYCSFVGRYDTHRCRMLMKEQLHDKSILFSESVGYLKYNEILNRSIFALAPRGYGYTSFRIYEALLAGCIPIYIWDDKKVLPYTDVLDWNSISIIVNSSEIDQIPKLMSEVDISVMQNNISKVREMFTFTGSFDYVLQCLKSCHS